jgi:hypothetical protein
MRGGVLGKAFGAFYFSFILAWGKTHHGRLGLA